MSAIAASKAGGVTLSGHAASLKTAPDKYISLGDLLDPTKPDNRDLLVNTYGDQGITGFLQLTGAVRNGGTADEVQWWEEGRLHKTASITLAAGSATGQGTLTTSDTLRANDVLLTQAGDRLVVIDPTSASTDNVKTLDGTAVNAITVAEDVAIIGNIYAQGTSQPSSFYQTEVNKMINPYFITKETYHVTGSQATNIGWINVGNGDYRWYVKGEMDTRKRFMNQREMMMLLGQNPVNPIGGTLDSTADLTLTDGTTNLGSIAGSEGYFQAVERRGITTTGTFGDGAGFADIDEIIFELDKQGAPAEYAMYVDTATSLAIDDMLAAGIATQTTAGLPGQFGAFQNSADMAVQLGFKSFSRGSYTFHKHGWKLLSDPTLLGAFTNKPYKGAMVPMTQVADAKTGVKSPALEMNYKEVNGYGRELEHWVEGGGVLGFATNDQDVAKFHYRSEANLVTRAANQHVVLT
jgi:hypothetical protein